MPELAEVEFMRRRWAAGLGDEIEGVELHARARVFRDCQPVRLMRTLAGSRMTASDRSGKRALFRFGDAGWLGVHLGMSGELRVEPAGFRPGRHDHLVLRQAARSLVFNDPRMFGSILFSAGPAEPDWWTRRPPEILGPHFTRTTMAAVLRRRSQAPLKAVLLMQEFFPGIGNWMADEVLWRAGLHPARPAGSLGHAEVAGLFRELRFVCRGALRHIVRRSADGSWGDPPRGWLFHVRWKPGGRCPKTGAPLARATVGGRTTCWSPARQPVFT